MSQSSVNPVNGLTSHYVVNTNVNKYIDIDSSYRDRLTYPEVGDFVMEVNARGGNVNAFNAVDPVLLAFPYDTGLLAASGASGSLYTPIPSLPAFSFLKFEIGASSRQQVNFYVGSYINFPYFSNDFMLIIYYNFDTTTNTFTILCANNPFGAGPYPQANEPYLIRYQLPVEMSPGVYRGTSGNSISTTQVNLGASASSVNDYYVGYTLFITPYGMNATTIIPYLKMLPQFAYQWSVITAYDGATKTATLRNALIQPLPLGTPYEILGFSYDNYQSLQYYGTEIFNNPRCASLSLSNLIIPAFLPLSNINSGFITDYPYVWVSLYSDKGNTFQQPVISASPASRQALFKCSLTFAQTTQFLTLFSSVGSVNVPFRINDNLHFQLLLPNGEIVRFNPSYYTFYSGSFTYFNGLGFPIPPDPRTQIQACFNVSFSS